MLMFYMNIELSDYVPYYLPILYKYIFFYTYIKIKVEQWNIANRIKQNQGFDASHFVFHFFFKSGTMEQKLDKVEQIR